MEVSGQLYRPDDSLPLNRRLIFQLLLLLYFVTFMQETYKHVGLPEINHSFTVYILQLFCAYNLWYM
jgi:hypothetical protein